MDCILEFNNKEDWEEFVALYNKHKSEDMFFYRSQPVLVPFAKYVISRYNIIKQSENAYLN